MAGHSVGVLESVPEKYVPRTATKKERGANTNILRPWSGRLTSSITPCNSTAPSGDVLSAIGPVDTSLSNAFSLKGCSFSLIFGVPFP